MNRNIIGALLEEERERRDSGNIFEDFAEALLIQQSVSDECSELEHDFGDLVMEGELDHD